MNSANTNANPGTNTAEPIAKTGVPPAPPEAGHQAGLESQETTGEGDRFDSGMTATYSPDDNKLRLYSVTRLDRETYDRVKAAGFAWAPKQGFFVAPMWTPERVDLLMELCGEIGDEDTSLVERAEERAERFDDYSARRGQEAAGARGAVSAITEHIPMGQPILVGHHSERRARKDAERIENGMRKAIKLWDTSQYWQQRAAGALRNAKYKERADVRHRRIKTIEADKRKQERIVEEAQCMLAGWQREGLTLDQAKGLANESHHSQCYPLAEFPRTEPASQYEGSMGLWSALDGGVITADQAREIGVRHYPATIARAQRWIAHYDNRLAYERAMLDEQGGIASDRFAIEVGGRVLVRGEWVTVLRVNKSGGRINSVSTNRRYVSVVGIEQVQDYQAPTAELVAKVKAATKLPPLCNYPGDNILTITQAQWDAVYKDHKRTVVVKADASSLAHRRRQVDNFVARQLGHEAARSCQWGSTSVFISDAKRVDPPRASSTTAPDNGAPAGAAPSLPPPERVAPRPVHQAPAPTEFDAMREQLRQGVKVVSAPQLFQTPAAIAARMVDLANLRIGQRVLEPSAGAGRLLQALPGVVPFGERRQTALDVVAVERNHDLVQLLRGSGLAGDVRCADFLAVEPQDLGERFDAVLMNPPFGAGADILHIEHARTFLKPGGTLVAICAGGPRQQERLRPQVQRNGGSWEALPAGSFEESGTGVNTVLLSFTVPVDETAQV